MSPFSIEDLVRLHMLDEVCAQRLVDAVRHRTTIVISGGTGTGKTTLLNSLLSHIEPAERVVLIEEIPELTPVCAQAVSLVARSANLEGKGEVNLNTLVRAALRMQADLPDELQMRIGVNTGEVVVGTLAGTEYTAMGDVMNTASRIQALAEPGTVLVGDATAALLPPIVMLEPHGVTELRGRAQSEPIWHVTGMSPTAAPAAAYVAGPFVGRVNHRAMLTAVTELVTAGQSAIVSVVGEPGIGKSRFVEEALNSARAAHPEVALRRGTCAPYDEVNIWSPLARAAADAIALDPDAPADVVRKAAEAHVAEHEDDEQARSAAVEALVHMLGHPSALDRLDGQGVRDEVVRNIAAELRRHAVHHPVILWIDDVQWADPALLEALRVAAQSLADMPLLVITAHRPDRDVVWPPLMERALLLRLPLGPLTRAAARELTEQLFGGPVDDELADVFYARSGGSPLFLTELAGMAASDGDPMALPGSLRALISARLDALVRPQRAIIDNASVLGVSGHEDSLRRFASEMGQTISRADLSELSAEGFLVLEGSRWRFRSDVVRDVAYQTLTKQSRAQRHAGVATALGSLHRVPVDEWAHHLGRAAELVKEMGPIPGVSPAIGVHAVAALAEAARRAVESGAFSHAERQATRALDLDEASAGEHRDLLLTRATAYAESHQFPEAYGDVNIVLEAALAGDDLLHEAKARRLLGTIAQQRRDLGDARRELQRAVELFRVLGDDNELAETLLARGFAEVFGGSLDDAEELLAEADRIYAARDDRRGGAWVRQHQAWVSFLRGDHPEADRRLVSAAETFDALGDRSGVSWANGLLAWVRYFQRRFDDAEELAESVHTAVRSWGDRWAMNMMQTLLANLRLWSGRIDEAEPLAERALAGFRKLQDPYGTVQALAPLSRIRVALGKSAEAERGLEELVSTADSIGDGGLALQAALGVAMHSGDTVRALGLAEQAHERRRASGADENELLVMRALVLCQAGQADEAMAVIEALSVDDLPFAMAVRAMARATTGDHAGAIEDARATTTLEHPSYFDVAVASLAGLGAAVAEGDGATTSSEAFSAALDHTAASSGDVVIQQVARFAQRCLVDGDEADESLVGMGGWSTIVTTLAANA